MTSSVRLILIDFGLHFILVLTFDVQFVILRQVVVPDLELRLVF